MLAELHAHTHYSHGKKIKVDGVNSPKEMVQAASKAGLDVIAITDHDEIKGALEAKKYSKRFGIRVIVGEEVSTKDGHILALGINEKIKSDKTIEETLDTIKQQDAISIASHPFDYRKEGVGYLCKKCDAIEIFNAICLERFANRKARKFASKNKLSSTAGSDAHSTYTLGHGVTKINGDDILRAVKRGQTDVITKYIPMNLMIQWATEKLRMSYSPTVKYMNSHYNWPKRYIGKGMIKLVNISPGKIDSIFKTLAYIYIGYVMTYLGTKNILHIDSWR